eukprot:16024-Heterococcus_DN1.PRE.1
MAQTQHLQPVNCSTCNRVSRTESSGSPSAHVIFVTRCNNSNGMLMPFRINVKQQLCSQQWHELTCQSMLYMLSQRLAVLAAY